MSIVHIDLNQLHESSQALQALGRIVEKNSSKVHRADQLASFTTVSGLDQLGTEHAGLLSSGPGSAVEVSRGLAGVIRGLARGVRDTASGFSAQEELFARGLAELGGEAEGSAKPVGRETAVLTMPEAMVPVPVVVAPKTIVPAHSAAELLQSYVTTHTSAIGEAVDSWRAVAESMDDVVARLRQVANDIQAANKGEVIDAIVGRLRTTSEAAQSFATNAEAMSRWTGRMQLTHKLGLAEASLINGSVLANPVPRAKQVGEKLALIAYAKFAMPPLVALAEPQVTSLLSVTVPPSQGGTVEAELEDLAAESTRVLDHHIEAIRQGTPDRALVREYRALEGFAGLPDGRLEGGQAPATTAQSIAAPGVATVAPTPPSGGAAVAAQSAWTGSTSNGPTLGLVGAPVLGGSSAGREPRRGNARGSVQRARPAATSPRGTVASASRGQAWKNATGKDSFEARRQSSRALNRRTVGTQLGAGLGLAGAGLGLAGAATANGAGAGAPGTGIGKFEAPLAQRGGVGATGGQGGGRVATSSPAAGGRGVAGTQRGVLPMGMGGNGQNRKSRTVKAVVSGLEQDANVEAIIGPVPPMVPGTIGNWARNPRR